MEDYEIISIVGNAKNAGKTTVMNAYLEELDNSVAITSIGLDGEEIDQVTSMEKPQIYVKPGYLIATALDTLNNFTCKYEILETTNIATSIGKIVLVRALSNGKALVAGPARVVDIEKLIKLLKNYQLTKIIIDGAFSRQVFAKMSKATILVIGANYSRDINIVVKDAILSVKKFSLKENPYKGIDFGDKITIINNKNQKIELPYSSIIGNVDEFFSLDMNSIKLVYFPKSLTNKFVQKLIEERKKCKFDMIIESPINIQLNNEVLEKLFKLETKIYVVNPINLALICYNPYSPQGYSFNDELFKEKLELALKSSVKNVLKDG